MVKHVILETVSNDRVQGFYISKLWARAKESREIKQHNHKCCANKIPHHCYNQKTRGDAAQCEGQSCTSGD